ncbi:MAG: metallophosphoesterase family protein [Exilispira sp.]
MKSVMKNFIFIILPVLLMILFIIFLFSLPATFGIIKWNEYYKNLFIKILFLPFVISFIGIFSIIFKKNKFLNKLFSILSLILNILFVFILLATTIYIISNSTPSFKQIQAKIFLLDTTGSYGLADIGIYLKTDKKEIIQCDYFIESDPNRIKTIKDDKESFEHKFIIKDLIPDSIYNFKLSNGKTYKIKTPAIDISENFPFSFAVSSDPHFGRDRSRNDYTKKILDFAQKDKNNSFFAILGDFVETGYSKSDYQLVSDFLSENLTNLPLIAVMGNHDAFVGGHRFYKTIFSPFYTINTESPYYKHYQYRLKNNNIHIINLSLLWGVEDFSLKQKRFLIKELSLTSTEDIVIILSHSFIYASGYTEEGGIPWFDNISAIKTLEPVFKKYDVDLVLSGHNHTMELIDKDNIYYAIIGAFGGLPDREKTFTSSGSLWYSSGKYGYAKISLYPQYFIITFLNENNEILFENKCNY